MIGSFLTYHSNAGKTIALTLITIMQMLGVLDYALYFYINGYLPSPFIYDKADSFMDLFHSMWWADNDGRYTEWGSIYPPLNFAFLNIIKWGFLGNANFADPFALRDEGFSIEIFFVCVYLMVPIIVLRTDLWKNFSLTEKVLIYLGVICSTPMLFALERGNLVIFTLIFLALALSNSGITRSASIATLINIKPYFALLLIHYAIKRRWEDFLICILMSGMWYLITGLLLDGNFLLFLENLFDFSQNENLFSLREVMSMPSSVSAFSYVLNSDAIQSSSEYSYIVNLTTVATIIESAKWFILFSTLLALVFAHKYLSDSQIIAILTVAIINLGIWVGGYSMIFYFALIPVLSDMQLRRVYFGILVLIFAPMDIISLLQELTGQQYSYLSNILVTVDWTLGLGSIVRPVLNLLLLIALFYEVAFKTRNYSVSNLSRIH